MGQMTAEQTAASMADPMAAQWAAVMVAKLVEMWALRMAVWKAEYSVESTAVAWAD